MFLATAMDYLLRLRRRREGRELMMMMMMTISLVIDVSPIISVMNNHNRTFSFSLPAVSILF